LGIPAKCGLASCGRDLDNTLIDHALGTRPSILVTEVSVKNKLRDLRAELDWTQADLAERLGVSRQTVNAIETEKYDPSLPLAFKIACLFRRQVEEVFKA